MILTIYREDLMEYTSNQLNYFFPDKNLVDRSRFGNAFANALDRLEFCFKHVSHPRYNKNDEPFFNYLYSDHYVMYLWYLSNSVWRETGDQNLASKLYYLNKALHSFDCMYDTGLPKIFLIFHSSGTMLGKAIYDDYFVALQGVTVGSHKGEYPVFGKGVSITSNASVIGNCKIGNRVSISARTSVFSRDISPDTTIFTNFNTGVMDERKSSKPYAQQFYKTDLASL